MKDEHRGLVFPGGEPEAVGSGGGRAETQLLQAGPLPSHEQGLSLHILFHLHV